MRFLAMAAMALCGISGSWAAAQQTGPNWGYDGKTGPFNWSKLDPAYKACSTGKEQSPIDIRGARLDKGLQPVEFHYMASQITASNTGRTVQFIPPEGSNYIVVGGVRYDLVQFHFHHPGEEPVKGKISDMSLHLLHKSADGKFLVIAVRLNEGNANAVMATLWPHLPAKVNTTQKVTELVNPAGLLPADRAYWTYEGSLTAPPCTEGVRWIVYKQEVQISRDQLRSFAALYKMNTRMVQATRGRKIEASE
jgi:carbonic anhydrase